MSEPTRAKPTLPSMSMHWRNIRSGVFEAHCARDGQVYVARLFSCCLLRLHRVFVARCTLHVRVLQGPTSLTDIEWEMNCNGLTLLDLPPDQADWAHPCHICTGTGAHPVHIRTGTGLTRLQGDAAQTESSARSADSVYAWVDPVPVQMWAGMSPVPVQIWAGVSPIPVQIWEGRAPSRGRCGQG